MPILFTKENVPKVLSGEKTVTRRRGKKRWNVGAIHQARTTLFGKPFAWLRVLGVTHEDYPGASIIGDGSDLSRWTLGLNGEAKREGFEAWDGGANVPTFYRAWCSMYGAKALNEPCYAIAFEVVPEPEK